MQQRFEGTIVVRNKTMPSYRIGFFDALASRCNRLCVITSPSPASDGVTESDAFALAESIRIPLGSFGQGVALVYWQKGLTKVIGKLNPDVIITEANPRMLDTRSLRSYATRHHIPLVGWGLGTTNFFGHGFSRFRRWRRSTTLRRFDGVVAYSELAREQYIQECGCDPESVFVAHNATTSPPLASERRTPPPIGPDAARFEIVSIGRLVQQKNYELLLSAVARIREQDASLRIVLIGDGPHRATLESRARALNVPCEFTGHLEGPALRQRAQAADLFVLPGLGGLAIQQAMSFGLPIIASEADGTERDLIRTNGWRFESGNIDSLVSAIRSASADPQATALAGEESFRIVAEEINIETMADKMIHAVQTTRSRLRGTPG